MSNESIEFTLHFDYTHKISCIKASKQCVKDSVRSDEFVGFLNSVGLDEMRYSISSNDMKEITLSRHSLNIKFSDIKSVTVLNKKLPAHQDYVTEYTVLVKIRTNLHDNKKTIKKWTDKAGTRVHIDDDVEERFHSLIYSYILHSNHAGGVFDGNLQCRRREEECQDDIFLKELEFNEHFAKKCPCHGCF